jgi:hypothetical protein
MWRWVAGATALLYFSFGLFEYLDTLPVTNGELLFLRTRQPYLVGEAIAHILRGSLNRVVMAGCSRIAARHALDRRGLGRTDRHRAGAAGLFSQRRRQCCSAKALPKYRSEQRREYNLDEPVALSDSISCAWRGMAAVSSDLWERRFWRALFRPTRILRPELDFFLVFLPLAGLICFLTWTLNWLLSLAGVFAVRDAEDAVGAISAAVDALPRAHRAPSSRSAPGPGLAHLVLFVVATTVASMPLGLASLVPWRLVSWCADCDSGYFALADWLYTARLAGYVCIAEMPDGLPVPQLPTPTAPPVQTTIDRDEPILSDLPNLAVET